MLHLQTNIYAQQPSIQKGIDQAKELTHSATIEQSMAGEASTTNGAGIGSQTSLF